MSIEIRELKIVGFIDKGNNNMSKGNNNTLSKLNIDRLSKKIKAECVEEILEILERKNRR